MRPSMSSESAASQSDVEWIIPELDAAHRKLPKQAIEEARRRREEVVPRLIEVLVAATGDARAGELREGQAPFFSLILLTEFKAKEALPAIVDAMSLPD